MPPNSLRSVISDLATAFAASVVTGIRGSNLEDIVGLSGAEGHAPPRRGPGRPRKTPDASAIANPAKLAGGGGQPDPLAVPLTATADGTSVPKKGAPTRRARAAKTAAPAKTAGTAKTAARPGRLHRRSTGEIAKALAKVVALVKSDSGGLRAEQIRERLGMAAKEMPRVLKEGLAKKVLKSKGAKRSTTYTTA